MKIFFPKMHLNSSNLKYSFVFLTEAGDGIGFGHLKRCISLKNKIQSEVNKCILIIFSKGEYIFEKNDEIFEMNWIDDPKLVLPFINDKSILIIDSYIAKRQVYDFFVKKLTKTVVIDDYNRIDYGKVELILNPNPYFEKKTYKNQSISKIYGGKDFIILSSPFINKKDTNHKFKFSQISIFIGGSDYKNILPVILNQISLLDLKKVIVLLGNSKQLKKLKTTFLKFTFKHNLTSEEIYQVFDNSKLVISGCGQTLHELSIMGKKTIGICYDEDQKLNQKYYLNNSFLKYSIQAEDLSNLLNIIREELSNQRKIKPSNSFLGLENFKNLIKNL
ncbi:MAG: hypothetical protein CMD29_02220 [Flavobacteriales bacterium]|nr:hypothetical protein [Flavobacteriales bacterium]